MVSDRTGPEREVPTEEHLADRRALPVDLDPAAVLAVTGGLGQAAGDDRQLALVGRIDDAAPAVIGSGEADMLGVGLGRPARGWLR